LANKDDNDETGKFARNSLILYITTAYTCN